LSGCPDAWAAFVDRYARVIHAAALRTLHMHAPDCPADDAQDVAQDVFVRLVRDDFRLLRTFDPSRAALTTWLTVVARSVAMDHARRKRLPTTELAQAGAPPAKVDSPADAASAGLELPDGLLTARQKLVLHLLFDRQLSVKEAAGVLGVDAQTIRSTKHKAMQRLREHFGKNSEVSGDV
jgi:RNA polymerase sigma-70 factor (ECF subfamily)